MVISVKDIIWRWGEPSDGYIDIEMIDGFPHAKVSVLEEQEEQEDEDYFPDYEDRLLPLIEAPRKV